MSFFSFIQDLNIPQGTHNDQSKELNGKNEESKNEPKEESVFNAIPQMFRFIKRKGSYKISIDPDCDETTEFTEQDDRLVSSGAKDATKPSMPTELDPLSQTQPKDNNIQKGEKSSFPVAFSVPALVPNSVPVPVPAPRGARAPVPKPRTVHNIMSSETEENQDPTPDLTSFIAVPVTITENDEDSETPLTPTKNGLKMDSESKPKLSLKKLQLTAEEKTELMNFTFSQDSDSETPASSSSTSSSSRPQDGAGAEEEGYSSGGASWGHIRQKKLRRGLRRKEVSHKDSQFQQGRVRSKFSPWNLSSPRLQHRFSVLRTHPAGTDIFQLIIRADLV